MGGFDEIKTAQDAARFVDQRMRDPKVKVIRARESAFRTILEQMIKGEWRVSADLDCKIDRSNSDLLDGHETVNKPIKLTMSTSMSDD